MSISALPFISIPADPLAMPAGTAASAAGQTSPFAALIAEFSQTQSNSLTAETSAPALVTSSVSPTVQAIPSTAPAPAIAVNGQVLPELPAMPTVQPLLVTPAAKITAGTPGLPVSDTAGDESTQPVAADSEEPAEDIEASAFMALGTIISPSLAIQAAPVDAIASATPATAITPAVVLSAPEAAPLQTAPALLQPQQIAPSPNAKPAPVTAPPAQANDQTVPARPQQNVSTAASSAQKATQDAQPAVPASDVSPMPTAPSPSAAPIQPPSVTTSETAQTPAGTDAPQTPMTGADTIPATLMTSNTPAFEQPAEAELRLPASEDVRATVPVATLAALVQPQTIAAALAASPDAVSTAATASGAKAPAPPPDSSSSLKAAAEPAPAQATPINPNKPQQLIATDIAATDQQPAPNVAARASATAANLASASSDSITTTVANLASASTDSVTTTGPANANQSAVTPAALGGTALIPPANALADAPIRLTQLSGGLYDMHALAVRIAHRAAAGDSRFEIRLDPPELGRIDVRLDVDRNGQVQTQLSAERPQTLDLLQRDATSLERALKDAGLDSSGLSFSLKGDGRQGQAQNSDGVRAYAQSLPSNDVALSPTEIMPLVREQYWSADMRLDIRV